MIIKTAFNIGQIVFFKTYKEQSGRFVAGINYRPSGITYELIFGTSSSWHYEFEIAVEKDVLVTYQ